MSKRLYIKTFGCQMNEHDSEKIAGVFGTMGYTLTDTPEEADCVILNTCTIREKAEQKAFSDLGRIHQWKQANPNLRIGVAGCVAQQEGESILKRAPYVDLVFGTDTIHEIPELLARREAGSRGVAAVQRYKKRPYVEALRTHPVKAWVTVVDGCDKFCSFCVVPNTRGRERSRTPEEIKREIEDLAERGYLEVTLLGQNVNAYGKDLHGGEDLADLLADIHDIPGIQRFRFVTSHPSAFTEKLARAMANLPKVCEALHLPVQSGSNKILNRMNRDYSREEYREKVGLLRAQVSDIALTTDVIVGFPGESDEDFAMTIDLLQDVRFDNIFAFKYSPRPHTSAAEMENQVPEAIKERRLEAILSLQNEITLNKNMEQLGKIEEVLIEGQDRLGKGRVTGRTRGNRVVHLQGEAGNRWIGQILPVTITEATVTSLRGEVAYS